MLSYLVSTAGHAQEQNEQHPHRIRSIIQLLTDGVREFDVDPVVGFTVLRGNKWECDTYSYRDLLAQGNDQIQRLEAGGLKAATTVCLLCPTGANFLVTWIGLMGLGCATVFVAPQCSPSAIAHLYQTTASSLLIYDPKYESLAHSAKWQDSSISLLSLPRLPNRGGRFHDYLPIQEKSISHIFHTSGTSGTPKPIPNTHLQSVACLPRRALPRFLTKNPMPERGPTAEYAAYTTTPLFHGGVSDLLRAWMARSMIYFYPTSDVPITVANVMGSMAACRAGPPTYDMPRHLLDDRDLHYKVLAFLSVPYILTVLADDPDGMHMLSTMELVSTGGAPLDSKVGADMVEHGVRLVSRLGSSECGFLLSSHRDYASEKDWEWLRNDSAYADALAFEPVDSDGEKFEMVVTPKWQSKLTVLTKSNRPDGSYATGDLYQPHPHKKNVWRYVGRGDDVIVLSNGEKVAPGPIEAILTRCPEVSDVLVVGSDKTQLGVLIFPLTPSKWSNSSLEPYIQEANLASPSFAQISIDMCGVSDPSKHLPKSSKGTTQRGVAYEFFAREISRLYVEIETVGNDKEVIWSEKDIQVELWSMIIKTVRHDPVSVLRMDTDLYNWGVNSLMATRLRNIMQKTFNTAGQTLPANLVFEKSTIAKIARYLHSIQTTKQEDVLDEEDPHRIMRDMVGKYGQFAKPKGGLTVLLTGATGNLGSYILSLLLSPSAIPGLLVEKVHCLVRASDDSVARDRVMACLEERGILCDHTRLEVHATILSRPSLVLMPMMGQIDLIIHAAWPVHFTSNLVSFDDSIAGLQNLLQIAINRPTARFLYCSSLASVLAGSATGTKNDSITESLTSDPSTASPIGYARSKWVAESVCAKAAQMEGMSDRIKILRVGQLCGDATRGRGHWNEKEGWPLLIKTAELTGCLPVLSENPSWLPVDVAARVILEIAANPSLDSEMVYHVTHPEPIQWSAVLDGLEKAGLEFDRVPPVEWLDRMDKTTDDPEIDPTRGMLHMWRAAYGDKTTAQSDWVLVDEKETPTVQTTRARAASSTLANVEPVGAGQINRMVVAWRRARFLTF